MGVIPVYTGKMAHLGRYAYEIDVFVLITALHGQRKALCNLMYPIK
jgi:hypothetical protein